MYLLRTLIQMIDMRANKHARGPKEDIISNRRMGARRPQALSPRMRTPNYTDEPPASHPTNNISFTFENNMY